MINKYDHPILTLMLHYWPATVFAPTVLVLVAMLALVTRQWDRHDGVVAREGARLGGNPAGDVDTEH